MSKVRVSTLADKRWLSRWRFGLIVVVFTLMVYMMACSFSFPALQVVTPTPFSTPTLTPTGLDSAATTPVPQLSAEDVANQAAARMAEVRSFHFSVRPSGNRPNIGPLLNLPVPVLLTGIEGDIVRPDRLNAHITVTVLGVPAHLELVHDGEQIYLNNSLSGKWEKLPQEIAQSLSPSLLFGSDQGLPALLTALDFKMAGFEEVQGELSYHLQARDVLDVEVVGFDSEGEFIVDVWVGMRTYLLRQARLSRHVVGAKETSSWLLVFSAFDRPVTITPPAVQ
jgi:hypothetical protein